MSDIYEQFAAKVSEKVFGNALPPDPEILAVACIRVLFPTVTPELAIELYRQLVPAFDLQACRDYCKLIDGDKGLSA